MKKIIPFYKNENLSPSELGYSSMKSALKYMKKSDRLKQDFNATLPENYWDKFSTVQKLEHPWSPDYKRGERGIHQCGGRFYIDFYIKGDSALESIELLSLSEDLQNLFKRYKYTTDKDECKNCLFELLKLGYYPTIYTNDSDYVRKFNKFIKSNVEFREVEFLI